MTKKIFAMFLAVLMVVSMLPTSVFAAGANCPGKGEVHTKSNCAYTEVGKVAPNCGQKGYTTYKCNTCGDTFVADFTDPVGEHNWKDADPVAETCEKNGSVGGKQCTVCGTVVDATPVDNIPDGLKCEFGAWLPANVDCTTGGEQTRTCVHCGNVEKRKVEKSADGHHMGAWELKTPATAEANGLAVKKCQNANCGYTVEQVVFFDHDHNAQTLAAVAEVAAKCEETGVKAHYECRVCGQKFVYGKASATATVDTYNMVTDAELLIPTLHDQIKANLNCKTTTYVCTVTGCGEIIKVDAAAAHKYGAWSVQTAPTCTTDGFQKRTCTVCLADTQTQIIPALGHIEGSWTVAATCVQYGYTYTYCLRQDCPAAVKTSESVKIGDKIVSFDLTLGATDLTQPVVGAGFYLNLYNGNKNDTYYFNGSVNGDRAYELATTTDVANAVKVYLEEVKVDGVENAYHMYFNNGNVKTYISIYKNGTYVNIKLDSAVPTSYWTWNAKYGVLVTNVEGTDYWMGNYNNNTVFKANKLSYLDGENQWPAKMTVSNANGVQLLTLTPNTAAGFDSTNHTWKVLSEVPATCLAEGVKISYCADNCGVATKTETLAKVDHNWVADTTKGSDNDGVDEATCTTAGKKYFVCSFKGCNETKEEHVDALGHTLEKNADKTVKVHTEPGNHTNPVAYDYNYCTVCMLQVNKTNYRAWENAGKIWDTLAKAEEAHGTLTPAAAGSVAGDCFVVGYTAYTCSGCSEIVRVKVAGTGAHVFPTEGVEIEGTKYTTGYKAPDCTNPGYSINYKCERCGKLIDEAVAENKLTVIPALGHTWKEFTAKEREDLGLGEYVKAPCGTPVYDNYIAYCSVCHPNGLTSLTNAVLKADTKLVEKVVANGALCTATVYELYECHCGETHMRGYLAAGQNVDHEWIVDATKTEIKATHTTTGTKYLVCKYCGVTKEETLPVLPHKNAAGEEFTDACNDPVTDRHCVLCCAADCKANDKHNCAADQKPQEEGVQTCPCVIGTYHNWGEVTYVDSICGDAAYVSQVCSICYKTSAVDAEKYVGADGKEYPVVGLNHKPVAVDVEAIYGEGGGLIDEKPIRYGAYDYVPGYKHYTYKWVNVAAAGEQPSYELHQFVDVYEAKFIKYTAPTYTADGYAEFVCADCGETIKQVLPAVSGLGFELEAVNANGAEEIGFGSLIEVTIYANANGADVYAFNFDIDYNSMFYVGYEVINEDFLLTVTDAKNATNNYLRDISIIARAANSADGKMQNVSIGEKTPVVKLLFRSAGEDATVSLNNGQAFELNALDKKAEISCAYGEVKIKSRAFLDFNGDGEFHITDLYQAESMLTGESEKTYDVTMDLDKDGRVSAKDLSIAYDALVGNLGDERETTIALFLMGIEDEAELKMFEELFEMANGLHCIHCGTELSGNESYCPNCGRNPN